MRWAAAWSTSGLAACGGGAGGDPGTGGATAAPNEPVPGGSSPGAGVAGATVSAAQRRRTFDALQARLASLYDPATGRLDGAAALQWLSQ